MAMLGVATAITGAIATGGGTASAAVISQNLDCGIGGSQVMKVSGTAPATVAPGGTFIVDLDPQPGTAAGGDIKNMVYSFQAPTGSSIVAGTAQVIGTGTNSGTVTASSSGSVVKLNVPGPVANGGTFDAPTLRVQLQATGAAGTVLSMKVKQSGAYTLTALGSINVSCDGTTPLAAFTSTTIQAATTTTAATSTTASTTTLPGATTTTGPTTTTGSTTTTTAPPAVTTQTWSPGGGCGTVQTTTVPTYATSMAVSAAGAAGGGSGSQSSSSTVAGGAGGQAVGTFTATPGQTISAIVGCAGVNGGSFANTATPGGYSVGGGAGRGLIIAGQPGASGGSGGGSSAACSGSGCKANTGATPLVVAGSGGGGGVSNCSGTSSGPGGAAGTGDIIGADGGAGPSGSAGASANSAGGAGGVNGAGSGADGGASASPSSIDGLGVSVAGGGGGAGFSGGSGGTKSATGCKGAGGGGGGSSWVATSGTNASFGTAGEAAVTVTFTIVTPAPTTTSTSTTSTSTTTSTTSPPTTTTAVPTCTPDVAPFASVSALVDRQIADFAGPTSIRSAWIADISSCSKSAEDLIFSLLPTTQTQNDAKLFRLYHAYFLRPPDISGLNHYVSELNNGRSLANIALEFSLSAEFKARYGTVENGQFVEMLYFNVLNRFSDPAGRAFWVKQLETKTQDRGQVALEFSDGVENKSVKIRYVDVFRMYVAMRGTTPEQQEFNDLVGPLLFFKTPDARSAAKPIRMSAGYAVRVS